MGLHEPSLGGPVEPRAGRHIALRPLPGGALRLEGGFWGQRQVLNREVTIPHGLEMLEEWGALDNLRVAAGRAKKEYRLPLFTDSDVYKVLEAIAWERQHGPNEVLERGYADCVDLVLAAQDGDGYVNSYVKAVKAGERFSDPAMGHELYCAGHLFQAAVAEARSPASVPPRRSTLADVAARFSRYLAGAIPQLPDLLDGHPEVEMALVELYRQHGDSQLLALAAELVRRRGGSRLKWGTFHPDYFQDDVPITEAVSVRGHAVRALYLLCGVADLYVETGRHELLTACTSQWEDMVSGKTYLTGGVGARHEAESFGERYELPSDRAYCETCAAVASVMWNWRMCLVTGQARYAELLERTLYNACLAGWGLDGRSFFYVNPLHVRGGVSRQRWYRCACCPPNLMRLVASLDHYVASRSRDGLQLHQFVPALIDMPMAGGRLSARLDSDYPYGGSLSLQIRQAPPVPVELAIRAPTWSLGSELEVNGQRLALEGGTDGYLRVRRTWRAGDEICLDLDMSPRLVRPDPRIEALRGCFALERGPLVYCFEAPLQPADGALSDLGATLGMPAAGVRPRQAQVAEESVVELVVPARKVRRRALPAWPYDEGAGREMSGEPVEVAALPYYAWSNRGEAEMRVWLPESTGPEPTTGPGGAFRTAASSAGHDGR